MLQQSLTCDSSFRLPTCIPRSPSHCPTGKKSKRHVSRYPVNDSIRWQTIQGPNGYSSTEKFLAIEKTNCIRLFVSFLWQKAKKWCGLTALFYVANVSHVWTIPNYEPESELESQSEYLLSKYKFVRKFVLRCTVKNKVLRISKTSNTDEWLNT